MEAEGLVKGGCKGGGKEAARFRGEIRIFPKISIYRFPIRLEGKIVWLVSDGLSFCAF